MSDKFAHRSGTVTIKAADGAGKEALVRQVRHKFLFGCSEFSLLPYVAGEMDEQTAKEAWVYDGAV